MTRPLRLLLALAFFIASALAQQPRLSAHLVHTFGAFRRQPNEVAFTPDGSILGVSSVDGTVKLFRVADRRLLATLVHPAGVTSIAFSADGQWLVSGSYDGAVRVWRVSSGA